MPLENSDLLAVYRPSNSTTLKTSVGAVLAKSPPQDLQEVCDEGNITTTGASFGDGTIALSADGSATFAGTIQVAGNPVDGADTGIQIRSSGDVRASSASGTAKLWQGYTTGTTAGTSWINADGSATFAHSVSSEYFQASRDTASYKLWIGQLSGVNTSTIDADGAATFGGDPYNGANIGVKLNQGYVNASAASGNDVWYAHTQGSSTITSRIKADGSATFAGNVQAGAAVNHGYSDTGVTIRSSGLINATRATGSNIFAGFKTGNNTQTSQITSDGNATFGAVYNTGSGVNIFAGGSMTIQQDGAGPSQNLLSIQNNNSSLVAGITGGGSATFVGYINTTDNVWCGNKYANGTGVTLGKSGEVSVRNDTGSSRVWAGFTGGNGEGNITSKILADGSATFTTYNLEALDPLP